MAIEEMTPTVAEALLVSGEGEEIEVEVEDTTEEAEVTDAATGETAVVAVEVAEKVAVGITIKDETAKTSPTEVAELTKEAVAAADALANAL